MPIFFQQDIDANTRLAVWKIEEREDFFLQHVPLQRTITHPHKRLQHLAGRYLLKYLFPSFPLQLIQIADTRKPFLEDEAFHFSISHCGDFAGVLVSSTGRVGMDLELVTEKIERISHKFLTTEEKQFLSLQEFHSNVSALTLAWSCKEAVFKWYSKGGVDFRDHMQFKSMTGLQEDHFDSVMVFKKEEDLYLGLHSLFLQQLCISYVIT